MIYEGITKIIGCAMKIHSTLETGSHKVIYRRVVVIDVRNQNLNFERKMEIHKWIFVFWNNHGGNKAIIELINESNT